MSEAKPNRRWFRFSLRTLFVVVTALCVFMWWVQMQRNFVLKRQQFFRRGVDILEVAPGGPGGDPTPSIPVVRKLLGDRPYYGIVLRENANNEDIDRANDLFPEALIGRRDESGGIVSVKQK